MRLGDLQSLVVDDVTFRTNLSWGDIKKVQKQAKKLEREAEELPEGEENAEVQLAFTEETLLKYVVSCEGLEDKDGKPIAKLTPEYLDELPPAFVGKMMEGLLSVGDDSEDASGNA